MPRRESSEQSFIVRNLAIIITLISMLVGVSVWAMNEHAKLKDWAIDQDNDRKAEVQEDTFNRYTQQRDSARSEEKIDRLNEKVDDLSGKVDEVRDLILGSTIKPIRLKPYKIKK